MIPQTPTVFPKQDWQQLLSHAIKDPVRLLSQLGLEQQLTSIDDERLKQFPLRVTQSYIDKMHYGDVHDPLLRQVFPLIDEAIEHPDFISDPVGDSLAIKQTGVLQKYQGRALLITTGACAIHCRYCFRRHFPYQESNPLASHWPETLKGLTEDDSLDEVILSGGDPLTLTDKKLAKMINDLDDIPHIKRLRIHTRLPIVLPERITDELIKVLQQSRLKTVMVIHANHANELAQDVEQALSKIKQANITLLNQTVLLKGINDSVDALASLSERLIDVDVLPYYLHLLDPVAGASHFDVSDQTGVELISQLRKRVSGYLVPRLVREQQGESSKTIIA